MARARNLKPGYFMNEELAECQPLARILFAALWTLADREGRLEDRPRKIKAEALPYDNCDVDALLDELFSRRFIIRYEVDNNKYIQVLNFVEHQNPHPKEPSAGIPEPCKKISFHEKTQTRNVQIPLPSSSLNPESLSLNPSSLEEKGVQGENKTLTTEPEKPKKEKRSERLEAYLEREGVDATAKAWGDWAKAEGMAVTTIDATMAQFRDWWRAAPAGKGVKADWPATWRGWVRRELAKIKEQERRDALFRQKR